MVNLTFWLVGWREEAGRPMTVTAVPVTLFFFNLGRITVESEPGSCKWIKDSGWLKRGLTGGAANISNAHCSGKSVKFGRKLYPPVFACARTQLEVSSSVVSGAADNGSAEKVKKSCQNGRDGWRRCAFIVLRCIVCPRGPSGSRSVITFLHKLLSSSANQFHRLFIVCVRERASSIKTSLFATLITCIRPTCTIVDTKLR